MEIGRRMIANINFTRPMTLIYGKTYLFWEKDNNGKRRSLSAVIFVNYTSCPAIVIVKSKNGSKRRCPREYLFELRNAEKFPAAWIELLSLLRHYSIIVKTSVTNFYQEMKITLVYPAS